ncbi:hypothetical protein FYK55_00520 [Roseiconus nitratireducens]|uniref:Uncharacterized protein n=1 Tax=Roseiconus nitratireducens TaxID=2605748 RepID=A0A5M6DHL4_9BACT|nr:hypothetical protein [Roseiconus nitratireducens]KAA5546943.1 hypothetical protein FYK55_00520 [Roseiconus nitratireducens]
MRLPATLSSVILVFGLAVFATQRASLAADSGTEKAKTISTRVYLVSDFPVWTSDKKFDPSVLMRLIQASVTPSDWEGESGDSTMAPYPKNASLVISTSTQNHDRIVDLFESMRSKK